jgi:hypothetical protein
VLEGYAAVRESGAAQRLMAKLAQTEARQLRWGG